MVSSATSRSGRRSWRQSGERVDAFVHAVSTAHSIHGTAQSASRAQPAPPRRRRRAGRVGRPLRPAVGVAQDRRHRHRVRAAAVETRPGRRDRHGVDRRREDDGSTAGPRGGDLRWTSSGANVVAAIRVAERLGPEATVATIIVDSGLRYLSTDVFRDAGPIRIGRTPCGRTILCVRRDRICRSAQRAERIARKAGANQSSDSRCSSRDSRSTTRRPTPAATRKGKKLAQTPCRLHHLRHGARRLRRGGAARVHARPR